jgi:hypothetical protein
VNRRIVLPGSGMELENGLNVPEKENEILKYMATVPQLRKQISNLEKTEISAPVYTCDEFLEKSIYSSFHLMLISPNNCS